MLEVSSCLLMLAIIIAFYVQRGAPEDSFDHLVLVFFLPQAEFFGTHHDINGSFKSNFRCDTVIYL